MGKVTIAGRGGEILYGYFSAATLGSWTVTAEGSSCALTADVVTHEAHRLQQRDLTFRVVRQKARAWNWPVLSLHIAGSTLSAQLGPQE